MGMKLKYDVLVIGSGVAGLRSALEAGRSGASVLLVSKKEIRQSGTTNAEVAEMAGFNASPDGSDEGIQSHYDDIIDAGQDVLYPELARVVAEGAPLVKAELLEWAVPFEQSENGLFTFQSCFSRSARTHVIKRHGTEMAIALFNAVKSQPTIKILSGVTIIGLSTNDNVCTGAYGLYNNEPIEIQAKGTILATGGGGLAFERSFSPSDVVGSGYTLAWDADATLVNMEFMQIGVGFSHPLINIFNGYIWQGEPPLTDKNGDDVLASILPAEISKNAVYDSHRWHYPFSSRTISKYLEISIDKAINENRGSVNHGVHVDLRHMDDTYLRSLSNDGGIAHMWPLARDYIKSRGLDLLTQSAEVAVFQHAFNGGVKIDRNAESTIKGLYAVGECAGGPHGADRLGGNMFVTSLVFGKIAGKNAASRAQRMNHFLEEDLLSIEQKANQFNRMKRTINYPRLLSILQAHAQRHLLVNRSQAGLEEMIACSAEIVDEVNNSPAQPGYQSETFDILSLATTTRLLGTSALARKESRGSHYRADYPQTDPVYSHVLEVSKNKKTF